MFYRYLYVIEQSHRDLNSADMSPRARIVKICMLDGSIQPIVEHNITKPQGIAVDYVEDR